LCEAELWDQASAQYQRMQSGGAFAGCCPWEYLARIRLGYGRYEKVLRMIHRQELDPMRMPALVVEACLRLGKDERARGYAEQALREKRAGAGLAMGAVHEAAGDLEIALGWYEWEASRYYSMRQDRPFRAAARVLMRLGEYGEARIALAHAVRHSHYLHPEDVEALSECTGTLPQRAQPFARGSRGEAH
jgi:hypothetical protein